MKRRAMRKAGAAPIQAKGFALPRSARPYGPVCLMDDERRDGPGHSRASTPDGFVLQRTVWLSSESCTIDIQRFSLITANPLPISQVQRAPDSHGHNSTSAVTLIASQDVISESFLPKLCFARRQSSGLQLEACFKWPTQGPNLKSWLPRTNK